MTDFRKNSKRKAYKSKSARKPYTSKSARKTGARKNAKSSINKVSGILLGANKVLRDINALQTGNIADRIMRRGAGKLTGQGIGKIFGGK